MALGAYRLVQFRPHLLSIALALVLYALLIASRRPPTRARIAAAAVLFALWANLHPGFPVGLLLLGGAWAGSALAAWSRRGDAEARRRSARLGLAWLAGLAATACNPMGLRTHAAWFAAGATTPSLAAVLDEWSPVNPFAWPQPTLPPTPLSFALVWALLLGLLLLLRPAIAALRGRGEPGHGLDPAAVGVAAVALVLLLAASRFLWLGIFPLLLIASAAGPRLVRPAAAWSLALIPALIVAGFLRWGDWPVITRFLPRSAAGYAVPYASPKYLGEPVWLLRDAELEGNLYADYFLGGFAGFWLAPRVRTLSNGTLNVAPETLRAAAALQRRRGLTEGESFPELLDRLAVDLFFGIHLPDTGNPHRPEISTTAHLDATPGWVPLFRNLNASLSLRNLPRNRENLERIARHYRGQGVPFDPERGFDPARVARESPEWAHRNGLVPAGFAVLEHLARTDAGARGMRAKEQVASLWTALGVREEAIELDRSLLAARPSHNPARRRLVWNLLHLGRYPEARSAAEPLAEQAPADWLSHRLADAAREIPELPALEARAQLGILPVFRRSEVPGLLAGINPPPARTN